MSGDFAAIMGTVTDGAGRPVRGQHVVLRSDTVEIRTQTDARGHYEIPASVVTAGTFTLEIGDLHRRLTIDRSVTELVLADATVAAATA